MFRGNRPLRRAARRVLGLPIAPRIRRQITTAYQLAQSGQPAQAAQIFAELAAQASQSGHPRQAANLEAQAAHIYIESRNEAAALAHARSALAGFQSLGMSRRLSQFWVNIQRHFQAAGMAGALASLHQEYSGQIPAVPAPPSQTAAAKSVHLPPSCPGCGAPLRSDEVDWVDDRSAECPYCGSVVLSE